MEKLKSIKLLECLVGLMGALLIFWFLWFVWMSGSLEIYPNDNVVEELIEEIIEYKTGIDIDLTPFSPED